MTDSNPNYQLHEARVTTGQRRMYWPQDEDTVRRLKQILSNEPPKSAWQRFLTKLKGSVYERKS